MIPFRKIAWIKSVTLEEGALAYPGRPGLPFHLHSTPEDADSLADPAVDDLMVLIQHDQLTHLVRVTGASVEARSPRDMKKGTRDVRYSMQRACEHVLVRPLEEALFVEDVLGFDPVATGGEVFELASLPAVEASDQPMWMVQRKLLNALEGPSMQRFFAERARRPDDGMPDVALEEFLRGGGGE